MSCLVASLVLTVPRITSPPVGTKSPRSSLASVVLPAPLAPTSATVVPGARSMFTSLTAAMSAPG